MMSARSVPAPGAGSRSAPPEEALAQLVARVASGDETALGLLYDATSRQVFALASRIVTDHQLAEEVTLDVYLQVWRRAGSYERSRGSVAAWLAILARSRAIDCRRAHSRREEALAPQVEPEGSLARVCGGSQDPQACQESSERRGLLRAALYARPLEQRQAIELAYFPGLSHTQVAERLGAPLGTVKTRIRLAMRKLRDLLHSLEVDR